MSTDKNYIEFIVEQASLGERLSYKKMFGEYAIYIDGKVTALACDNSLYIKSTAAAQKHCPQAPARPPYQGAKPHYVIDLLLDYPQTLRALLLDTAALLPAPKPKSPKPRKHAHSA